VATFRYTQVIERPVADVFDTVIHVERFPDWSPRNPSARKLTGGEIGEGSEFEMGIKGFGKVHQELQQFERDRRVRIVPSLRMLQGGHLFVFTDLGGSTRVDHELEMRPKGVFKLMAPMVWATGRKNLRETADALQRHLERAPGC
jgi:uncharacterized protein YndB with AHSA1/START domain